MQRSSVFIAAIIIIVLAVVAWWGWSGSRSAAVLPLELGLVAEAVNPMGTVVRVRDGEETPVTDHLLLAAGDVVRTGPESGVSLEFFAGSRVGVDAESEVKIHDASVDEKNARVQRVAVELNAGRMWARVLKILDLDGSFVVTANQTTATVRGTAFAVTYHAGAAGSNRTFDLFGGVLGMGGTAQGDLLPGFTYADGSGYQPEDGFTAHLRPTSDAVRNDPWIRSQLEADKEFVRRVAPIRERLGDRERDEGVGDEAGAFTADVASDSGFVRIEVEEQTTVAGQTSAILAPGGTLAFKAYAVFRDASGERREDVTDRIRLAFSTSQLRSPRPGMIEVAQDASGPAMIVARYNDGTREHSAAFDVYLGGDEYIHVDTQMQLLIDGQSVGQ